VFKQVGDTRAALFPISLSAQNFSTKRVSPVLTELFQKYDKVVFFVADRLQIYNKALETSGGRTLSTLIQSFNPEQRYLEERNRWINRLITEAKIQIPADAWTIMGLEDVADEDCLRIFRNVMLAYYAIGAFRQDIHRAAQAHAVRRSGGTSRIQRQYLSRGYLLDEIAVSIRLHVIEGIRDEYYIGQQPLPVMRLYGGQYGVMPCDLADVSPSAEKDRFFSLPSGGGQNWTEVESDRQNDLLTDA
jgi:hypothetical protein